MRNLISKFPLKGSDLTLTLIAIVGVAVLGVASNGEIFRSTGIQGFLSYLSVPILIGLAQMTVLGIGQLNLAIGAMGGTVCALMAVMMADGAVPVPLALLIGLAASAVLGAINGILVVVTQLHGFIVTLGTMTILMGIQFAIIGSRTVSEYPEALRAFGRQNLAGIPYLFIATVVIALLTWIYFSKTVSGRQLLASGGSEVAARLSGISNSRSTIVAYSVSGLLTGFAALASIASLPGINISVGTDWLLPSFAAPLIGGVLLTGGSVAVYGTIIAACILRVVDIARVQFLLEPSWTYFVIGSVVLSTVAISEYRKRRRTAALSKRGRVKL